MERLYYCDHHAFPLPAGHRFPVSKYRLLREALAAYGCFEFEPSPSADPEVISLVHDRAYVEGFLAGSLDPRMMRRIGFPWSEGLVRRTLASVGGTLLAAERALDGGWGGNLAGGTHHASRSCGSGFCVFNDIAIAVEFLRRRGRIRRTAVVDLDVHQGDGTAEIFEHDTSVFTLSVHARNNFPFRKRQSSLDVELEDATGDHVYLRALADALPRAFAFRPDIVFYQAGVDALAEDRLGRLALTLDGLRARDEFVIGACRAAGVPVVVTLGGGYAEPIELTVCAHAGTFLLTAPPRMNKL